MELIQVSISTKNKDKLVKFYKSVFGFLEVSQWSRKEWGMSAVKLSRGGVLLEISQTAKLVKDPRNFSYHNKGLNMFGIEVGNLENVLKLVKKEGGKINEGPLLGKSVKYIAFIEDPDGNGIELMEPNLSAKQVPNLKIIDWDREEFWSTGNLTTDIEFFHSAAQGYLWQAEFDLKEVSKGLLKIGDISGCPIPDKVAEREGIPEAIKYLYSLCDDFNFIKTLLEQEKVSWSAEWGEEEKRKIDEPLGEDGTRVPQKIRVARIVRGVGNYHEFSITRLLWVDKKVGDIGLRLGRNRLIDLVLSSDSKEDLQVKLINEMGDLRAKNNIPVESIVSDLSKGICHEGFFRQNNCYTRVGKSLSLLKKRLSKKEWFEPLATEVERVLSFPVTKLS